MIKFRPVIGCVGSATVDLNCRLNSGTSAGQKQDIEFDIQVGGGGINVARQCQWLSMTTRVVSHVGLDDVGRLLSARIEREFSQALCIPALPSSRISVLREGNCWTSRPPVKLRHVPGEVLDYLSDCDVVLLAPATNGDTDYLLTLIDSLPAGVRVIIQLSSSQLASQKDATRLLKAADVVVMNEAEASVFSRSQYPHTARQCVHSACPQTDLIVTSSSGAWACFDGVQYDVSAMHVPFVKQTTGAGDVFTGTFLSALVSGRTQVDCVSVALQAAALHVAGHEPLVALAVAESADVECNVLQAAVD